MSPKIKIDFYRVVMPDGINNSFHHLLQAAAVSPNDSSRNITFRGVPIRLQEAIYINDIHQGEMIRIRLDRVPIKVSLAGALEVIDLEPDEGMGEETAFLYDVPRSILIVQRNHFGVSVSAMAHYFQKKGNLAEAIRIDPILNPEAYARLNRMNNFKKFDICIAGIENYQVLRDQGVSGRALANLMERLHAPNISVTLSMGRSRSTFVYQSALQYAEELFGFAGGQGHVNKLEISGTDYELGQPLVIDLINDRMVETVDVSLDDRRRLPYQERIRALSEAMSRRNGDLARLYNLPED